MLKFPNGCARLGVGANSNPTISQPARKRCTNNCLLAMVFLLLHDLAEALPESLEGPFGHVGMEDVKIGIGGQLTLEGALRLGDVAEIMIDHAGMEKEPGVLRAELCGLCYGSKGLLKLAIFIQGPGQQVIGVD